MDEPSFGKNGFAYFWGKLKPILNAKANKTDLSSVAVSGSYNDLTGKPSTFPPSSHRHTMAEAGVEVASITEIDAALGKQ